MSKIVKGENHPDTVAAIFEVASTFTDMGLQDQAIPLLEFCIETNTRLLGFEHKKMQDVFYDLIFCLMDKGLFQQALPKAEVHRDIYLRKFGPDHPDTISAVNMTWTGTTKRCPCTGSVYRKRANSMGTILYRTSITWRQRIKTKSCSIAPCLYMWPF
jgi:hypothetical protein